MVKRKLEPGINGDEPISEELIVNVKQTLNQFCTNTELKLEIQRIVRYMSRWAYESSKHLLYDLITKANQGIFPTQPIEFRDYFVSFQNGYKPIMSTKCKSGEKQFNPNKGQMMSEYQNLRATYHITEKFEASNNILEDLVTTYQTNFINNIQIHTGARLNRYFQHRIHHFDIPFEVTWKDVNDTLSFLFYKKTEKLPHWYLISALQEDFGQVYTFYASKKDYWKSFEFLYKLQRYNDENKLKNFKLIPQFTVRTHHIRIDNVALYYILKRNGLTTCNNLTQFRNEKDAHWRAFFNVHKVESRNRKFRYSIKTDGVAVSISIAKTETPERILSKCTEAKRCKYDNETLSSDAQLDRIRSNADKFDAFIGLDPGIRLMVGGVSRTREQMLDLTDSKCRKIKLKSTKFHHEAGFPRRRHKLWKLTSGVSDESKSTISPMCAENIFLYIDHSLANFHRRFEAFTKPAVTRLRFDKYTETQKAANRMANFICGDAKRPLIAIGSTRSESNSPVKKYIRTPHSKLLEVLKERAEVLEINEFMTTQACSNCQVKEEPVKTSRGRHRYQFCNKCGKCFNRDVNAGFNILQLAWFHHVKQEPLQKIFIETDDSSTAKKKSKSTKFTTSTIANVAMNPNFSNETENQLEKLNLMLNSMKKL